MLINSLEKVQGYNVGFVMGQYDCTQSCTLIKNKVNWDAVEAPRRNLHFKLFPNQTGLNPLTDFKGPHYVSKHNDQTYKI